MIVGFILGVIAIRETKRTGQEGYGVALAGTILGGLALAAGLIANAAGWHDATDVAMLKRARSVSIDEDQTRLGRA